MESAAVCVYGGRVWHFFKIDTPIHEPKIKAIILFAL